MSWQPSKQFSTPGGQKTLRNKLVTNHLTCINAESPFQLCNSGFDLCPTKHPAFSCNFTNAMFSFQKKMMASQMQCFHVTMQQKDVASCSRISLKRRSSIVKMNQENCVLMSPQNTNNQHRLASKHESFAISNEAIFHTWWTNRTLRNNLVTNH